MPRRLIVPLLVLAATIAAACGEPADPNVQDAGGEVATEHVADAEAVGFAKALAEIRGHHFVSLELYEAGDVEGAAVHAAHPVDELLASVQSELDEHAPEVSDELAASLQAGVDAIAAAEPADAVAAAFDDAAAATEEALAGVAGADASSPAFRGSVIALLLATAAHEYEEAVDNNGLRLLAEYQDGYGFVHESRRLYEEIAGDVEAAAIEEAEEIEEAFDVLEQALPSPEAPKKLVDPLEVETAAALIGHELEETVGASPAEESDPDEIVAEIEELLAQIESAYEAGAADQAAELAAEAYLENYEVIEADVIDKAPDVNEELEPLLGAELRRQIGAGAPVEEISSMIDRAIALLAEALAAISEH